MFMVMFYLIMIRHVVFYGNSWRKSRPWVFRSNCETRDSVSDSQPLPCEGGKMRENRISWETSKRRTNKRTEGEDRRKGMKSRACEINTNSLHNRNASADIAIVQRRRCYGVAPIRQDTWSGCNRDDRENAPRPLCTAVKMHCRDLDGKMKQS